MIFEKPSLRTRAELRDRHVPTRRTRHLPGTWDIRLGERETVADVARNLARVVDMIVARTFKHTVLAELASHATVPVINGLSDLHHPCQVLADLFTLSSTRRKLDELRIVFIGDGTISCIRGWRRQRSSFAFALACPSGYEPDTGLLAECRARGATIEGRPRSSTRSGADASTPTSGPAWTGRRSRRAACALRRYQINDEVLRHAPRTR